MSASPDQALPPPSRWLQQWVAQIRPGGTVLDLAAGRGRNACWLAAQGFRVDAVDRDADALAALAAATGDAVRTRVADLEGGDWPYTGTVFDAVVVCRYLHRPRLAMLAELLAPGGVLIYETFMQGHAAFGRPSNPDFLLRPGELREVFAPLLDVLAYEERIESDPPAAVQRLCARRLPPSRRRRPVVPLGDFGG